MKRTIYLYTAALGVVLMSAGFFSTLGQSLESPLPVASNVLTINGPKKVNQEFYYSFTAGPGEVTMTFNVKAKTGSTFVGVKVFDSEMNTLTYHNMSADTSSPGVAKKTFEVGDKQVLLLSFTSDSSLAFCKITFGGAVELGGTPPSSGGIIAPISEMTPPLASATGSTVPDASLSTAGQGEVTGTIPEGGKNKTFMMSILDAVGQRFNIPANGKLRIEMKDGTVQEIDLTQVKKILVKK